MAFKNALSPILTPAQFKQIERIDDKAIQIELVGILTNAKKDKTLTDEFFQKLVQSIKKNSREEFILTSPEMKSYQEKLDREIFILRSKIIDPEVEIFCNNCKVLRIASFKIVQKKSADEPATITYKCKTCSTGWAVNG